MADFNEIVSKTFKFEGGFQNSPNDSANYCNGKLIGTNRGISAVGYSGYLHHCPSVEEIKAITPEIARNVYRTNYWNPIQGDKIKDQSLAHIIFDSFIASGGDGLKRVKKAVNEVSRKPIFESIDAKYITSEQADQINSLNPKVLFDKIHEGEVKQRKALAQANPQKYGSFLNGWLDRLSKITYSGAEYVAEHKVQAGVFIGGLVLITLATIVIANWKTLST